MQVGSVKSSGWKHFSQEEIDSWPEEHKLCRGCNKVLPLNSFHSDKKLILGRASKCKECRHLDSVNQWKNRNREKQLYNTAKSRAKLKGREFTIDLEDIVIPDVCPVLNVPIGTGEYAPSVDRTDHTKGYIKGNVRVISTRANRLKNDATAEELQLVLTYITNCEV